MSSFIPSFNVALQFYFSDLSDGWDTFLEDSRDALVRGVKKHFDRGSV